MLFLCYASALLAVALASSSTGDTSQVALVAAIGGAITIALASIEMAVRQ